MVGLPGPPLAVNLESARRLCIRTCIYCVTLVLNFTCPTTIVVRWVFLVVRLAMNGCPLILRSSLVNSSVAQRWLLHCLFCVVEICVSCDAILMSRWLTAHWRVVDVSG